ncbi:DUF4919 domain-containing protein [Anatilimnocola floriformis]|uniref:DUF4919 domain-containing protein n=1 Tax=Anatilimnocola floriformis TaxID=2948575 RepID=UPI0020C36769|nr:DUF4919 domain-containing protein [Anatilimnocola floriformis]
MYQEFARFLELPGRATFIAARAAWLQQKVSPLTPEELQSVAQLLAAGEATAVIEQVHSWKSRAAFSPRAHYFCGEAHALLGELEQAEVERLAFSACLQGILATGDGSRLKPYIISQIPDEYDVLKLLGLTCQKQRLVQRGRRSCDVLTCQDGSSVWFNISDLLTLPAAETKSPAIERVQIERATTGFIRTKRRPSGRLRASPR